jgi:hypothetical protein
MENQMQTAQAPSITPVAQPQPATVGFSLSNFASLNPVAALMVKDFGQRERQRRVTTLTRYQRHLADTYKQDVGWEHLIEAFKVLNDLALGALITGRGEKTHRFKWAFSLRDVARAAAGEIKAEEMSKAPTGKTRIVYPKNYKKKSMRNKVKSGKATKAPKVAAAAPAPVVQAVANNQGGVEVMILQDGVYKRYEIAQDKKQLFETLLPSLAVAK